MLCVYNVAEPRSSVSVIVAFWPVDSPFSSPALYWWSYVYVSRAESPSLTIALSTDALRTIFVADASPPPPPLPAGMSTEAISAPLLLFRVSRTVLSSSLTSAPIENTVFASIRSIAAATAAF